MLRIVLVGESGQETKDFGTAVITLTLLPTADLPHLLIHRFFHSVHTSGVDQMDIILRTPNVEPGIQIIDCARASIVYRCKESQVLTAKVVLTYISLYGTVL